MKKQTVDLLKSIPMLLMALGSGYTATYAAGALHMNYQVWDDTGVIQYTITALFGGFFGTSTWASYMGFAKFVTAFLARFGTQADKHLDEDAVDEFAQTMKDKLAQKREEGLGGWDNPAVCPHALLLSRMRQQANLRPDAIDPIDVANYAMMTWHRGMKK